MGQVEQWQWAFMCTPPGWLPVIARKLLCKGHAITNPFSNLTLHVISFDSEVACELYARVWNMWLQRSEGGEIKQEWEKKERAIRNTSGNGCKLHLSSQKQRNTWNEWTNALLQMCPCFCHICKSTIYIRGRMSVMRASHTDTFAAVPGLFCSRRTAAVSY